jgi:GMP synthase (glutamine-hydrolysing)
VGYDGVVLTGSALNIYDASPATRAQLDFARAVYRARVPFFGSCWGLQVAAAAAGGEVVRNPKGREAGVARAIVATQAGRAHPMLAGRGESWDAPCHHLDVVARLPDEATLLASNTYAQVQAAEIRFEGGVFWGVQYHPEFSFGEIASVLRRCAPAMRDEGFYRDADEAERHCDALETLDREPARTDLAWRLGVQPELVDAQLRVSEIRNFIESYVRPEKSRRGRA